MRPRCAPTRLRCSSSMAARHGRTAGFCSPLSGASRGPAGRVRDERQGDQPPGRRPPQQRPRQSGDQGAVVIYDWHKFSRPRVALFNRVMAWVLPCITVAIWVLCLRLAMHDWTVLLAPLIPTAAAVTQRLALRKVYRAEPDYSAIARMEMESFGRTFEHAGAPSGQSASGTYAIQIGRASCR